MQRRQFLQGTLSLGAAGLLLPGVEIASGSLVPEVDIPNKTEQLRLLKDEISQCRRCHELALTRTQTVFGVGNPDADILFLAEAPSKHDDEAGEPFVGQRGNASIRRQLFDIIITQFMKLRREDVFVCNVLRCRPPEDRNPHPQEIMQCRPFLDRTLEIVKPKFVCCLGRAASQSLLGSDKPPQSLRGKVHDYNGISVVCTYQPTYLLGRSRAEEVKADIRLLRKILEHERLQKS